MGLLATVNNLYFILVATSCLIGFSTRNIQLMKRRKVMVLIDLRGTNYNCGHIRFLSVYKDYSCDVIAAILVW